MKITVKFFSIFRFKRKLVNFVILTMICLMSTIIFVLNVTNNFKIIASSSVPENNNTSRSKITNKRTVKILSWTKYYSDRLSEAGKSMSELGCSDLNNTCTFSDQRDTANASDIILFHWHDINFNDLPKFRSPNQVWLLYNWETPCNSKKLPQIDLHFNWTTTYRLDSTLLGPTSSIVKRRDLSESLKYEPNMSAKTKLVAWIVSNCRTVSQRENYVKQMQQYISVDIYGRCGKLKCISSSIDKCYHQIATEYKFYLAFENSICKDYVTEKLWETLHTGIIPVVFGGAQYEKLLPENSYIDALKYTPKELAEYLHELDANDAKYKSYFRWQSTHVLNSVYGYPKYVCIICDAMIAWRDSGEPVMSQSTSQINKWYYEDSNCRSWQNDVQICV